MKTTILILIALLTSGCVSSSPKLSFSEVGGDGAVYTITGKKDPRLDAWYSATYVSQNLQNEGCYSYISQKGFRRPIITGTSIFVKDENYTIKLPITLKDKNECDYRFRSLDLVMKRKYDEKLSSIHYILSEDKLVRPIYWKTDGGSMSLGHKDTPSRLETDKKYFRIAEDSTFLCKTLWFPKKYSRALKKVRDGHSQFHCTMQIDSDIERALYKMDDFTYGFSHPEFGIDEIKNTNMKIDILVDEKNCKKVPDKNGDRTDYFRELKKPNLINNIF